MISRIEKTPMNTSEAESWEREYTKGGIPSSVRTEPSGAVVDFFNNCVGRGAVGHALDIGCGSGRNSLFIAERGFRVQSIDYAKSQIEALKRSVTALNLVDRVDPILADIRTSWPVVEASVDVVVDAFCFKHQITSHDISHYASELGRVSVHGAKYLISFAGRDDGYYSKFPHSTETGPGQVIVDPQNQIASRLYEPKEVLDIFHAYFSPLRIQRKEMKNEMHGGTYDRVTHILWLERRASN